MTRLTYYEQTIDQFTEASLRDLMNENIQMIVDRVAAQRANMAKTTDPARRKKYTMNILIMEERLRRLTVSSVRIAEAFRVQRTMSQLLGGPPSFDHRLKELVVQLTCNNTAYVQARMSAVCHILTSMENLYHSVPTDNERKTMIAAITRILEN